MGDYKANKKGEKAKTIKNAKELQKDVTSLAFESVGVPKPIAGAAAKAYNHSPSQKRGAKRLNNLASKNPLLKEGMNQVAENDNLKNGLRGLAGSKMGTPSNSIPGKQSPFGTTKGANRTTPNGPQFGKNLMDDDDFIDGEDQEQSGLDLLGGFAKGHSKKGAGTAKEVTAKGTATIKIKIYLIIAAVGVGLLLLLLLIALITNIFGMFAPAIGLDHELGNDLGGQGGAVSEEHQEYIDNLVAIQKKYKDEEDKEISAQAINATLVILQNYDSSISYDDMSKNEMKRIANIMVNAKEELESDSNDEEKVQSKTKEKLAKYFEEKIPGKDEKTYLRMADEVYEYLENYEELINGDKEDEIIAIGACSGISYWWPIGSAETTTENGKTFAKGDPETITITATFAGDDSVHNGNHGALDISGPNALNKFNIIAALDGTVVYPITDAQTQYSDNGYIGNRDGGGFGNYVIIEHADGNYTYYAHMAKNSITVRNGDQVRQGQVIGKMGHSGSSTGAHLHFEVRAGGNSNSNKVDPLEYVDPKNPRSGCSEFSLETTSLTEQEFISKMEAYCKNSGNTAFCNNFSSNAKAVYKTSLNAGVNPELVVVTAGTEMSFKKCGNLHNYWGIGISNGKGCSAGPQLTTLEAGIKKYAETLAAYKPGGSKASLITSRYEQREQAGCSKEGHGLPGTLTGMQSVYSWLGNYRYNPGSSGLGGCYYLKIMYGQDYCERVPSGDNVPTTICEQNDYTAWQLKGKREMRKSIFGL